MEERTARNIVECALNYQ